MRKFIVISVMLAILATSITTVPTYGDEAEEVFAYEGRLTLINILGIAPEFEDNSALTTTVTRAQLAAVAARLSGHTQEESKQHLYFSDVPSDHWASSYIGYVAQRAIMRGVEETRFMPEDTATMAQAVTVLTKILGYDLMAEQVGGYPTGYFITASNIGLYPKSTSFNTQELDRLTLGNLVVNALETNIFEQTKFGHEIEFSSKESDTLMYRLFSLYKGSGRVTANEVTAIGYEKNVDKGTVEINGEAFNTRFQINPYLGLSTEFYYEKDEGDDVGTVVLMFENKTSDEVIEIKSEDILLYSDNRYIYNTGDKRAAQTALISLGAHVIYNERYLAHPVEADYTPTVGKISLIDFGGDGLIDLVLIHNYEYYYVSHIGQTDEMLYDKYGKPPLNVSKDDNLRFVKYKAYGNEVALSYFKEDDVLEVLASKDQAYVNIAMVTEKLEGTITEMDDEFLTVGTERKRYVKELLSDMVNLNNEVIKEGVTFNSLGYFYISNDLIVAYTPFSSEEEKYGYLMQAQLDIRGVEKNIHFKILVQDEPKIYVGAQKIRFSSAEGSESMTGTRLYDSLPKDGDSVRRSVIRFKTNNEGQVSELMLPKDMTSVSGYKGYSIDSFTKDYKNTDARVFRRKIGTKYSPSSQTKIFMVPINSNAEDKAYQVGGLSLLGEDMRNISLEIYDSDEDTIPKIVVIYNTSSAGAQTNIDEVIRTGLLVLSSVSNVLDNDGDISYNLTGYQSGTLVSKIAKDDVQSYAVSQWGYSGLSVSDLEKGDVIQYRTNKYGNIDVFLPLFKSNNPPQADKRDVVQSGNPDQLSEYDALDVMHTIYGQVTRISSNSVTVNARSDLDSDWNRTYLLNTSPQILLYEKERERLSKISAGDIKQGDMIFLRDYYHEVKEIIVYR